MTLLFLLTVYLFIGFLNALMTRLIGIFDPMHECDSNCGRSLLECPKTWMRGPMCLGSWLVYVLSWPVTLSWNVLSRIGIVVFLILTGIKI